VSPGFRRLVSVLLALLLAVVIIVLLEHLADTVSPQPAGFDLKRSIEEGDLPTVINFALVLGGWLVAAWVGGTVASRMSHERGPLLVYTVLFTAITVANLLSSPHPTWMWVGALCVPLFCLGAAGESITLRRF
jgi:hypothetical protein